MANQGHSMRMDTVFLVPMAMAIADRKPDSKGTWLLHWHVNDHYNGRMIVRYQALP